MLNYLETNELPENANFARDLILQADQYLSKDGLLYHVWYTPAKRHMPERNVVRLYIPKNMINLVLTCSHDHVLSAHFGFHRTFMCIMCTKKNSQTQGHSTYGHHEGAGSL